MARVTLFARPISVQILLFVLAYPLAAGAASYTPPSSNRATIPLSGTWRFLRADSPGSEVPPFDDSSWPTVTVPHTWNNIDGQDGPDVGGDPNGRGYYRGIGRYRRHFSIPAGYTGRRLFLQFEGSNLVTEVWVNGFYAGRHEGGFTAFRFDVTGIVDTAAGNDNVIAVKVDNSNSIGIAPLAGDFTFFGGIYRDVSLVSTDLLSADMLDYGSAAVYLTQTNVSQVSADLEIKTLVYNAYASSKTFAVKSIVVDAAANIVATRTTNATLASNSGTTIVQNATITDPHLWDGRSDPYLYSVYVEVHEGNDTGPVRDLVPAQTLGFRSYYIDPNQGFVLNDHYLDLHGVSRHQDRFNKGWAISQSDQDQDMKLIEEIGATAVRLAHYPHAQYFYSLADKNGMIIWAELPVVNGVGGSSFLANARLQLIELIRQNYNHPAVMFWSIANEPKLDAWRPDPNPSLTDLNALAKQEDPYRLTTLASCCVNESDPTTSITDIVGYNTYFGWYYGMPDDFGGWADTVHRNTPTRAIAVSEYGAGASIFLHAENPSLSSVHTEEYQAKVHESHWRAMKTRPFLWGKFVWNMFDFASDTRNEGDTPGRNDKGLVTYDRATKKDAFYWYKANWTIAPLVYITSRRWTDRTVATTDVKVYSNADSVELLLNGVSLGARTAAAYPDRIFTWKSVVLNVGANSVQAIGTIGSAIVTDTVSWNLTATDILPPTIATGASATPAVVTATTTTLSVLGADDGGEAALTYTWTTTGTVPAPVTFSVNGSNAAKNTVVSFVKAGSYTFQVTVQDIGGRIATSSVTVTVTPTLTSIQVSPSAAAVPISAAQQFTASAADQFGSALTAQPSFTWAASGGGSINATGLFTAGATAGSGFTVTAANSGRTGTATLSVVSRGFSAAINFQPSSAPTVPGYLVDGGAAFGDRGNGFVYGWTQDASAAARDRNSSLSPDQRYDTLIHMGALTWEIAVPNGTYSVHAVVGDPSYFDLNSKLTVEGVLAINGLTSTATPWLEGTVTVTVSDGRLTVANQAGSYNKICYIDIISTVAVAVNQPPAVSITSPLNGATFTAPATIAIVASASDTDGTVAKVEFFDSGTKLGEDTIGSDGWSLVWTNVQAGTHTVTARATDSGAAATLSSPIAITVAAPPPPPPPTPATIRLDVGSSVAFTDSAGTVWQADQYGSGGTVSYKSNAVDNTVDDDLYRTYRFGNFTYAIPVPNGTYDVTIRCIETWWTAPGQRIFSVAAEGVTKLANLDLFALGGKFTAIDRTFSVTVGDGVLNLTFSASVDNAIVSAIAVVPKP